MLLKEMVLNAFLSEEFLGDGIRYSTRILRGGNFGRHFTVDHPSLRYTFGLYEPDVTLAMKALVHKGDVAYDVGSHAGYFSLLLSGRVGSEGAVYSFEPDSRSMKSLGHNIRMNHLENVSAYALALAESNQELPFVLADPSYGSHIAHDAERGARMLNVQTKSLDKVVYSAHMRSPSFVKIDVVGEEVAVLKGATATLDQHRPVVVAEIKEENMKAALEVMSASGYYWDRLSKKGSLNDKMKTPNILFLPEEDLEKHKKFRERLKDWRAA